MRIVGETFGDFDWLGFAADDGLTGEQDQVEFLLLGRVGLARSRRAHTVSRKLHRLGRASVYDATPVRKNERLT